MPTEIISRHTDNMKIGLPFDLPHIPDDLKRRAKQELFEDEDTRIHSLRLLRSMLEDESDLEWQDDDEFLLAFLRARKFDVKRAFTLVKTFYAVIGKHDELYYNFKFDKVRRTLEDSIIGFLPYRDEEGCVILIIRTCTWNPHDNPLSDIMRALTCGLLHAIRSPATQVAGFKVIVDFTGFTFKHATNVQPTYLWLFSEALQNCFPGRFRAVHIVNEGQMFNCVWTVLKPLLAQKLRDRFHFHGKNVKKLHKYFSPSVLPAEYEGDLPHFDSSEWGRKLEDCEAYLTEAFSYGFGKYKTRAQEKHAVQN